MLAFLFAVVSLSNIDPEAIVTPAPLTRASLSGSSFAPGADVLPGLTADIGVAPVCTFGTPRFGNDLFTDASTLSRTLAPTCAGMTTGLFGNDGFLPMDFAAPWYSGAFVHLAEPSAPRAAITATRTTVSFPAAQVSHALPQRALQTRALEQEESLRVRSVPSGGAGRPH